MAKEQGKQKFDLLMDQVMVIASIWAMATNDALEPSIQEKYKARVVLEQALLHKMFHEAVGDKEPV